MGWVKVDENFPDHPKVIEAGPSAAWLYICGLTYCSRYLTDGFIPCTQIAHLSRLSRANDAAKVLVKVGLWDHVEGGYRVHDYLRWQTSREQVEHDREAARNRQRIRRGSGNVRPNIERSSPEVRQPEVDVDTERTSSSDSSSALQRPATRAEEEERLRREAERLMALRPPGVVKHPELWLAKTIENLRAEEDKAVEAKDRYELAERRRSAPCLECEGTGWVGDEPVSQCPTCEGSGIRASEASITPLRTMTAGEGIQSLRNQLRGQSEQPGVADATECVR